jgi:glycosyltransferase involved in cell wall biosynthesis
LNRFKWKKNLVLLIEAAAWIKQRCPFIQPEIVIAGGYDKLNVENVVVSGEMGQLAGCLN